MADYPETTTRERGRLLVEELRLSAEDSDSGDQVRLLAEKLRRDFALDEDLTKPIQRFPVFRDQVAAIRYQARFENQDMPGAGEQADREMRPATSSDQEQAERAASTLVKSDQSQ